MLTVVNVVLKIKMDLSQGKLITYLLLKTFILQISIMNKLLEKEG